MVVLYTPCLQNNADFKKSIKLVETKKLIQYIAFKKVETHQ